MKQIMDALRDILTHDPILISWTGRDIRGDPKMYPRPIPSDVQPPFLAYEMSPGQEPIGVYGDQHAILVPHFQVTVWDTTDTRAWQFWALVQETLEHGEWSVPLLPYKKMLLKRLGNEYTLPEQETHWTYIPTTYRLPLSK